MYSVLDLNGQYLIVNSDELSDIAEFIEENKDNCDLEELIEDIESIFDASAVYCCRISV